MVECVMPENFTPEEAVLLAPYVTNLDRSIFCLKNLPEEVIAVLFAYYSRSRESLRRNLLKLIQDQDLDLEERLRFTGMEEAELAKAKQKAKEFHEKWVVGYGHSSVAEHAMAHLAVEDVSIIASKIVEDMRLAAYTEKSTRYVVFEPEKYYADPAILASPHAERYEAIVRGLLQAYIELTNPVIDAIKAETPRGEKQTEGAYHAACRAKACDILRYLLPAATLTNIGVTINGRALEYHLTKMFSHPLAEVREIGRVIKEEAIKVIPTLIKYANENAYLVETRGAMERLSDELFKGETAPTEHGVRLVRYPEDAEAELVAGILYGYTRLPMSTLSERVKRLTPEERARVVDEYLSRRGPHDQPLRALEHLQYTYEITVDYGAYRDLQRHRMATQILQPFSPDLGYATPPEVEAYGHGALYHEWMARAAEAYRMIARDFPREAAYVLPLAYRIRVLFTWNLRELHHFVPLRSAHQGHISYRRVAQDVYRELERVHPQLARYLRVDLTDYAFARL